MARHTAVLVGTIDVYAKIDGHSREHQVSPSGHAESHDFSLPRVLA